MDGIVLELQKEALDKDCDLESLLRKALVVARKLQLTDFQEWIQCEQNGYKKQIPEYRYVAANLRAWNPYNGWIPVVLPAKIAEEITKVPVGNPISFVCDTYNNSSDGSMSFSVNPALTELLNESARFPTTYNYFTSKSEFHRLMSAVRDKVLDWAILLEENGIIGENLSFTDKEKQIAKESSTINNYTNNFYGEVSDIDIGQGGGK